MAAHGRGRGESKNVGNVDDIDPRIERDRRAQLEAASAMGMSESEIPVRGRGGFRQAELRTIPSGATQLKVESFTGSRQVEVLANYVPINTMPQRNVQMYRVDFEPEVESASRMRFLFRTASRDTFTRPPIYDGVHECRSAQKLANKVTTVSIQDPQDETQYQVKFTNTGTSTLGAEFIRTYNMHMKEFLRTLGFYSPQVGLFVHPNHADRVGDNIMMLRGYRTAANVHDGKKILMNLEASHKLVQKQNLLSIMQSLKDLRPQNLQESLRSSFVGKIVVTSYNKRCYRVEDIDFNTKVSSTFDRNGSPVTYREYYREQYNINITDDSQPMLIVVPNNQRRREEEVRTTLLVPELCNLAGLTDRQRADNRLKMDLIRASQVPPAKRVEHMRAFLQTFHGNKQIREQLQNWGYSYGEEPARITAHVVAMTNYAYGDICRQPPQNWTKADMNSADIRVNSLAVTPEVKKLVILIPRNLSSVRQQILSTLKSGFDQIGFAVGGNEVVDMNGDRASDYISYIREIRNDTTAAIVVMQNQNKERYDAIKKAASVEKGIITQVVTSRLMTDQRKARSAAQKIAIQVAAKVGGEPWWVDIPMKNTMICGYDTYHDTAKRGRSFGAFVASLNLHFSRWWSKADAHERMEEISSQMPINVMDAINVYKGFNNNSNPERIIIYRDGVGEGQLEHVFRVELEKIREALSKVTPQIKLTMVVVNKRIGARFYMKVNGDIPYQNPPPGTVVDHTVTREERYDFYLISQSTRQGTVTPTYYNIIHDEAGFKPEIHQKLAFKMCLLYYNWSGTVRVPAPCQYAHKLALLCGEHLHNQPNSSIDNKLHYL